MLEIQKFLHEKSLELLSEKYGIKYKINDKLIILNYDQIISPKFEKIVGECRSLILDNQYNVVCRSMDRFFNLGECPNFDENKYPIKECVALEKVDGSLISVFHNDNKWEISTRQNIGAQCPTSFCDITFREVFLSVFDLNKLNGLEKYCFAFELVSPETRVVTPYPKRDVFLLTARNIQNHEIELSELELDQLAIFLGVKRPKKFSFHNIEQIQKSLAQLPYSSEGYVCLWENKLNGSKYRLKIKNPAYLAVAHLRNNGQLSAKRIAWLIVNNEYDEYLSYFKEDKPFFDPYIEKYNKIINEINESYPKIKHLDQKQFALKVLETKYSVLFFNIRKGISPQETMKKMCLDKLVKVLEED